MDDWKKKRKMQDYFGQGICFESGMFGMFGKNKFDEKSIIQNLKFPNLKEIVFSKDCHNLDSYKILFELKDFYG